jgi:hypothetical protein
MLDKHKLAVVLHAAVANGLVNSFPQKFYLLWHARRAFFASELRHELHTIVIYTHAQRRVYDDQTKKHFAERLSLQSVKKTRPQ